MAHAFLFGPRPERVPAFRCSKMTFQTRRLAMQRARQSRPTHSSVAMGSGKLVAFRCNECRGWHLTHQPAPRKGEQ